MSMHWKMAFCWDNDTIYYSNFHGFLISKCENYSYEITINSSDYNSKARKIKLSIKFLKCFVDTILSKTPVLENVYR